MTRLFLAGPLCVIISVMGTVGCSAPEPLLISELSLEKNPNERVPLAAICRIATDRASMVRVDWTDGGRVRAADGSNANHPAHG